MGFSVLWVYGFFCFLGLWVQYSCVWDFGFWNWSLRVLGIASFVLILLITNSLRFCANFVLILGFVLILLVFELLLLGVILKRENIIDGFFWVYGFIKPVDV